MSTDRRRRRRTMNGEADRAGAAAPTRIGVTPRADDRQADAGRARESEQRQQCRRWTNRDGRAMSACRRGRRCWMVPVQAVRATTMTIARSRLASRRKDGAICPTGGAKVTAGRKKTARAGSIRLDPLVERAVPVMQRRDCRSASLSGRRARRTGARFVAADDGSGGSSIWRISRDAFLPH